MKKEIKSNVTPKVGDSVYIGFITENGVFQKGKAMFTFDKIAAVYSETSNNKKGDLLYHVRVKSGDFLKVLMTSKGHWQAVA